MICQIIVVGFHEPLYFLGPPNAWNALSSIRLHLANGDVQSLALGNTSKLEEKCWMEW